MLKNKKGNMTPYNMSRRPAKQYPFLMPFIWVGSFLMTRKFHLKIDKSGIKGLKPPFLVIATHQGFSDYYIGPLAMFPHRAMYVSDMEGFAAFGNVLYRGLGCIPKRRYVSEISVVRNMHYGLSKGQSVFLYPESRHSNAGTTSYIPHNIGKLIKSMKVPVVTLSVKGSYLANPFWDEEHTRRVPMKAALECICTKEELETIDQDELQRRVEEKLQYDEYRYQQESAILIKDKKRAEGLHKVLYQCKACETKYRMSSMGSTIQCDACGSKWNLSEDGWLVKSNSEERTHIPDWYEWQRKKAIAELYPDAVAGETGEQERKIQLQENYDVTVEALPNEYGFVNLGEGKLLLDAKEFVLKVSNQEYHFPHHIRESVQTEYDYRGRGMCIVLSTSDCCYYIYSRDETFQPTRLQFLGEYLYIIQAIAKLC